MEEEDEPADSSELGVQLKERSNRVNADQGLSTSAFIKFLKRVMDATGCTLNDTVAKVPNQQKVAQEKEGGQGDDNDDDDDNEKDSDDENSQTDDEENSSDDDNNNQFGFHNNSDDDDDEFGYGGKQKKQSKKEIGKNALHFVVEKNNNNVQMILYLLMNKVDVNACDGKGRTPLFYLIEKTKENTMCYQLVKLLIKYGAKVDATDSLLRTPLHYAFCSLNNDSEGENDGGHGNNNNFYFHRNRFNNNGGQEPIELCSDMVNLENIKINHKDKFGKTALHYAAKQGFTISSTYLLQRGAELNAKDNNGNTALVLSLLANHMDYAVTLINKSADIKVQVTIMPQKPQDHNNRFNNRYNRGGPMRKQKKQHFGSYSAEKDEDNTPKVLSLFNYVLSNNMMGLAYLFIDLGVDPTSAVEDALTTFKFNIVPTLISKTARNVITKNNENKQNLFHIIAKHNIPTVILSKIGKLLTERNVSMTQLDNQGMTPLHLACIANNLSTVKFFLQHNCDANVRDKTKHGFTPIFYCCKSNNLELVKTLLHTGKVDLNITDAEGKTALFHAISPTAYGSFENTDLVRALVEAGKSKQSSFLDTKDKQGRTPLFYAYLQSSGTLSKLLLELGAKDANSAIKKEAEKELAKIKKQFTIADSEFAKINSGKYDVQKDADEARARIEKEIQEKKQAKASSKAQQDKKKKQKVDKHVKLRNAEVLEHDSVLYDTLLQKTEIEYGTSGVNNFYKMQIVWNRQQEIYVLFTRFGRVGETGQYQNTPFPTADEAVSEFDKIFKSKTGNKFSDVGAGSFSNKPNKYRLVDLDPHRPRPDEILKPIDLALAPASKLNEAVQLLLSLFCDVGIMRRMLKNSGLGTRFNIAGLSREVLQKATETLKAIGVICKQLNGNDNDNNKKDDEPPQPPMDMKTRREKYEELMGLSNQFYNLIPHTEFVDSPVSLISADNEVREKMQILQNLSDFRIAARLLIASMNRIKEISPLDYCYQALNTYVQPLQPQGADGQYQMLSDYINASANTGKHSDQVTLLRAFRVARREEQARFTKFETMKNRMLLWHGSSAANFISILNTGLKIAPPDVPIAGAMFGRGIYFADCFAKSLGYTRYEGSMNIATFVLCQVALGEMNELVQSEYMEKPKTGTNSTKGMGKQGPDFKRSMVRWDGTIVPSNKISDYEIPAGTPYDKRPNLNFNEYIVYDEAQVKIEYIVQVKIK